MSETEFTSRIEEHEANVTKYTAVLGVLAYAKAAVLALAGICVLVSLLCVIKGARKFEMFTVLAIALAALACILLRARRVRERIAHSSKIIITNKRHLEELEVMLASYPENSIDFLYSGYVKASSLNAEASDYSFDVSPVIAAVSRERAAASPEGRSRASASSTTRGNSTARDNSPAHSDRRIPSRARNLGRMVTRSADSPYSSAPAAESYTPSPQWEQYLADYKQVQEEANARADREDVPMFAKVAAMKFLLM